jgi:hypothetical protein
MIKNQRSFVSKNSNSLNALIKKTSMTFNNNNFKKITSIATAILMLSAAGTLGFSANEDAFAKKPDGSDGGKDVVSWSNGFPSGPHWNLNIHGKQLGSDPENKCDNSPSAGPFGASVFVPLNTTEAEEQYPQYADSIGQINFVSNKRAADVTDLTVIDPCGAPFGNVTGGGDIDEVLVQYPTDMEAQVYWRILGNHGGGPNKDISEATISHPALLDTCDFLPEQYADGTTVQWFDPDCTDCQEIGLSGIEQTLTSFTNGTEMYENSTVLDAGFSQTERVANANNTSWEYLDGSIVAALDDDETTSLFNFTNNFMYNDTNTSTSFSLAETVYDDVDGSGTITPGDIRVANAASVGLDPNAGGDLLTCEDSERLVGLGLVSNKGAFDLEENQTLVRFDTSDTYGENPGQGSKKGKSKAIDITGLFKWTGSVCEAAGLDSNGDNKLTIEDFDVILTVGHTGANVTTADLDEIETLYGLIIDPTTIATHDTDGDGGIESDEFDGWIQAALDSMTNLDGENVCRYYDSEWVFNVADIVLYGFDYKNNGSSLTQLRFYPTESIDPVE